MSFCVQYHRMFNVFVLDHDLGSPLADFAFSPSPSTRRIMSDHQLVHRPRPDGFDMYYCTNPLAVNPLLGPIRERVKLSFHLQLLRRGFFNRYHPDLTSVTGPQIYLDNLTPTGLIQSRNQISTGDFIEAQDAFRALPRIFRALADVAGGPAPTKFVLRDKFHPAIIVKQVPIPPSAAGSQIAVRIDMTDKPPGLYILETDAPGSTPNTIYLDDELVGAQVQGAVDLHWENSQTSVPAGGLRYDVRFKKH